MNNIQFKINQKLDAGAVAEVFRESGIRRPADDLPRIQTMLDHANLTVSAWENQTLVGIARALTDFSFCCYLSDLAVVRRLQRAGIGRRLVEIVYEQVGESCGLILLSAPDAMEYYPKIGFEPIANGFIIKRRK